MMLMPRIFDDDFFRDDFFRGKDKMQNQIMKTDIQEDEHAYTLDIDLPGYNKEDIKIDVTNGYLNISAKTNHEEKDEKNNTYRWPLLSCGIYNNGCFTDNIERGRSYV